MKHITKLLENPMARFIIMINGFYAVLNNLLPNLTKQLIPILNQNNMNIISTLVFSYLCWILLDRTKNQQDKITALEQSLETKTNALQEEVNSKINALQEEVNSKTGVLQEHINQSSQFTRDRFNDIRGEYQNQDKHIRDNNEHDKKIQQAITQLLNYRLINGLNNSSLTESEYLKNNLQYYYPHLSTAMIDDIIKNAVDIIRNTKPQ
jgi:hypothetical protein